MAASEADDNKLPEIQSFNVFELDVSGLDMRLELTTLLPRVMSVDCGPSYGCSCYSHNVYNCSCHSHNTCCCNVQTCSCHSLCEVHN